MTLKVLARAVLERNHAGNNVETNCDLQGNFRGKNEGNKFPEKFKYVSCIKCNHLDKGYCKAWGHKPDFPDNEVRLCGKYLEKIDE